MFKIISINETQFFCNGCGEVFVWEFNTPDKKPPKDWDGRYDTASLCSINVPDYRGASGLYPSGFDTKLAEYDKDMKNVQGLSGPWSIDIMLNEGFSTEHFEKPNEFWLIDMAVAERSAYWEKRPSKLALETVPEKED